MAAKEGETPHQRALGGISDALGRIRSCLFGLRDLGDADKQWVGRAVKVAQEEIENACEAEAAAAGPWQCGEPGEDGVYLVACDTGSRGGFDVMTYREGEWYVYHNGEKTATPYVTRYAEIRSVR